MTKKSFAGVWFFGEAKKKVVAIPVQDIVNFDIANLDYKNPYFMMHKNEKKAGQILVIGDTEQEIIDYNDPKKVGRKRFIFSTMRRSTAVAKLNDKEKEMEKEKTKAKRNMKKILKQHDIAMDKKILAKNKKLGKILNGSHDKEEEVVDEQSDVIHNTKSTAVENDKKTVSRKEKNAVLPAKEFLHTKNVLLSHALSIDNKGKPSSTKIQTTAIVHEEPRPVSKTQFPAGEDITDAQQLNYDNIDEASEESKIDSQRSQKVVLSPEYVEDLKQQVASFDRFKIDTHEQITAMQELVNKLAQENQELKAGVTAMEKERSRSSKPSREDYLLESTPAVKTEPDIKREMRSPCTNKQNLFSHSEEVIDLTDTPSPSKKSSPALTPLNNDSNTSPESHCTSDDTPDPANSSPDTLEDRSSLEGTSLFARQLKSKEVYVSDETARSTPQNDERFRNTNEVDSTLKPESRIMTRVYPKNLGGIDPSCQRTPRNYGFSQNAPSLHGSASSFKITPSAVVNTSERKTVSAKKRLTYTPSVHRNRVPTNASSEKQTIAKQPTKRTIENDQTIAKQPTKKKVENDSDDSDSDTSSSSSTIRIRKYRKVEEDHLKITSPQVHA